MSNYGPLTSGTMSFNEHVRLPGIGISAPSLTPGNGLAQMHSATAMLEANPLSAHGKPPIWFRIKGRGLQVTAFRSYSRKLVDTAKLWIYNPPNLLR